MGSTIEGRICICSTYTDARLQLYKNEVHAKFDDYDLGMEYARLNGKPVMLDFTGYGCVNCRKMETAVWIDPKVSDLINNDYVLITLM